MPPHPPQAAYSATALNPTPHSPKPYTTLGYAPPPPGRLLSYSPASGHVEVLASGMWFANGVALAADDSYALVTDTLRMKVLKYWIQVRGGGGDSSSRGVHAGWRVVRGMAGSRGVCWIQRGVLDPEGGAGSRGQRVRGLGVCPSWGGVERSG